MYPSYEDNVQFNALKEIREIESFSSSLISIFYGKRVHSLKFSLTYYEIEYGKINCLILIKQFLKILQRNEVADHLIYMLCSFF